MSSSVSTQPCCPYIGEYCSPHGPRTNGLGNRPGLSPCRALPARGRRRALPGRAGRTHRPRETPVRAGLLRRRWRVCRCTRGVVGILPGLDLVTEVPPDERGSSPWLAIATTRGDTTTSLATCEHPCIRGCRRGSCGCGRQVERSSHETTHRCCRGARVWGTHARYRRARRPEPS